ncbi:hypothetical protein EIP91_006688 [Steccherinum ochraceum]|uniref:Mediator of RNA polymerase II transcription subunit 17 n=1 Tax=Steccherinum ochraceum TaxID=92696 RepID=A0A4R0RM65_9APHY|nr:hypothetical protein EIP91_006688 [Steccherinum ochraceum]
MAEEQPEWKRLKLSVERPYKDDQGHPIPVLLDITPEGQHIYEPRKDLTTTIGEKLHRIFLERGHNFFEKRVDDRKQESVSATQVAESSDVPDDSGSAKIMTPEELFQLRIELIPQLHIALGEMSQAKDLLSVLLAADSASQPSSSQPLLSQLSLSQPLSQTLSQASQQSQPDLPAANLTSTTVAKPPPVQSVHAFNTQLTIGGKDKALRHAAGLFKSAAQGMEKSRLQSEKYWIDALKIRRNNWGLIPAPLPPGSATGKGADRTSKDFLVSFGLEESPIVFKRRAIGRMSTIDSESPSLRLPSRQHMRLQVSLVQTVTQGRRISGRSSCATALEEVDTQTTLKAAQTEVVEQEIFSILVREASTLPTASARVSERLIAIEAAHATELRFELVDSDLVPPHAGDSTEELQATCDLIYSSLHLLLLRSHSHAKSLRLGQTTAAAAQPTGSPLTLQPIIDMLQYRGFCQRIQTEIQRVVVALSNAGVATKFYFNAVGEEGEELITQLLPRSQLRLSGECLLRIDNRRSLRFTFSSPSTLTAHLSQATLPITHIPQLVQLLGDEVTACLLERICEVGGGLCEYVHGTCER